MRESRTAACAAFLDHQELVRRGARSPSGAWDSLSDQLRKTEAHESPDGKQALRSEKYTNERVVIIVFFGYFLERSKE
jgi:hypothetical protein